MKYKTVKNIYSSVLNEAGRDFPELVVLDADLARATQTDQFQKNYSERYRDVGIAEQNLASIAAGISLSGRPVIISTFAVFLVQRALDQVATSVALNNTNVKVIGIEAGLSSGRNGATHQAVEDLAITRAMPNMTVMEPLDTVEIKEAVYAALKYKGPVYMRMRRGEVPQIFSDDYTFQWGKGVRMNEGDDVTLISFGAMTETAIEAAAELKNKDVQVDHIHLHTLKPLDEDIILSSVKKTGAVVTAENHSIIGGLGGAVAELLGEKFPAPMRRIGLKDTFGECGSQAYLAEKYGLSESYIIKAVYDIMK